MRGDSCYEHGHFSESTHPELPVGSIPTAYPCTRVRTTPLCSLCWALTSFVGPLLLSWERQGVLRPQSLQSSQGKDLSLAAPLWETHWALLHLTAASEICRAKLLGNNSSVLYLLRRILVSGSETNISGRTEAFFACKVGLSHCFSLTLSCSAMTHANEEHLNSSKKNPPGLSKGTELGEREGKMYLHSHHDSHQSNKQLGFS